ncbi:MAG: hypothetical protein DVB23_000925 [Verrucomicrobia bacterium]|jgi:hypothetical protein|nr:MAG: hypothetical protein DVB23_000925 [Verrucomicrobiota bacterium]
MKQNANTNAKPNAGPHQPTTAATNETERSKPTLKPWMIRVFQGAGVPIPPDGSERDRLAWQGVEMQRFLGFSRTLAAGTSLPEALDAYGRQLKSRSPALEDWRLDRARDALRTFRRGSEGWQILDGDNGIEVKFRTKTTREEESLAASPESAL